MPSRSSRSPLAPVRTHEIGARILHVFDDVIDAAQCRSLDRFFQNAPYTQSEFDSAQTATVRQWVAELDLAGFRAHSLCAVMQDAVATWFPARGHVPYRVYCNNILFGDTLYAHRDCEPTSDELTALFYPNATWSHDWAGETVFFDDAHDAVAIVSPRPGRMVVFDGAILHSARPPSRACMVSRLSLAVKFRAAATTPEVRSGLALPELGLRTSALVGRWTIVAETSAGRFEHEIIVADDGTGALVAGGEHSPLEGMMSAGDTVRFSAQVRALGATFPIEFRLRAAGGDAFTGACLLAGNQVGTCTLARCAPPPRTH
jgi:hypothetical protein